MRHNNEEKIIAVRSNVFNFYFSVRWCSMWRVRCTVSLYITFILISNQSLRFYDSDQSDFPFCIDISCASGSLSCLTVAVLTIFRTDVQFVCFDASNRSWIHGCTSALAWIYELAFCASRLVLIYDCARLIMVWSRLNHQKKKLEIQNSVRVLPNYVFHIFVVCLVTQSGFENQKYLIMITLTIFFPRKWLKTASCRKT